MLFFPKLGFFQDPNDSLHSELYTFYQLLCEEIGPNIRKDDICDRPLAILRYLSMLKTQFLRVTSAGHGRRNMSSCGLCLVDIGLAAPPAEGPRVEGRHVPVWGKSPNGPVKFRLGNLRTGRRITTLEKWKLR